ncbi:glycosyltransferase family 4 protein [Sphingobacterium chungjuense]|uniref:glycosyltransferase family 4 protein n=1 Tax=Sphingobacterium chungjuense TaxID=2675553 RepID=UPI00140CE592|nr:glycosyltransferase [Sphingobacterium chungjuense]
MKTHRKLFFWQNTNSIHQSALLESLAKNPMYEVHLIVTEALPEFRKAMGWQEPKLYNVNVHNCVAGELPLSFLQKSTESDVHIFSGINAFPNVHKAFRYAIKNAKGLISVFSEPLDYRGIKGKVRIMRAYYHKIRFGRKIDFILATGKYAVEQFLNVGYAKSKVFEWSYVVHKSNTLIPNHDADLDENFRIIFAASLIPRKGYDILLRAVKMLQDIPVQLDMYCVNEKNKEDVSTIVNQLDPSHSSCKVSFFEFLPNDELRNQINNYDLLVLPSRHDGWGAIINESLMEGTPVIVSSNCGSSSLINYRQFGNVLKELNPDSLNLILRSQIQKGKVGKDLRKSNRDLANRVISGEAMASYFNQILSYQIGQVNIMPKPPYSK